MKITLNIIVACMLFVLPFAGNTQNYCLNYHKKFCKTAKDDIFTYNGQSRSALFEGGQTSELRIVTYKGQDYRVTICADKVLGDVKVRILETKKVAIEKKRQEKVVEDVYDAEGNPTGETKEVVNTITETAYEEKIEVLYDNSKDNNAMEVEFTMVASKKLVLELTPSAGAGEMGCIGVLIQHMPTPKKGF
jgi:hypothetical protein